MWSEILKSLDMKVILTQGGFGAAFIVAFVIAALVFRAIIIHVQATVTQMQTNTQAMITQMQQTTAAMLAEMQQTVRENTESNRDMLRVLAEMKGILSYALAGCHHERPWSEPPTGPSRHSKED